MASAEEVAVFVETNLGTHIAMAVPIDITTGDFKKRLEQTHASCSPSLGDIQVYGLMVKRKSYFYYLPEPLPIKHIFQDFQKAWFICAEARLVNGLSKASVSNCIHEAVVADCSVSDNPVESILSLSHGEDGKAKKTPTQHVPRGDILSSANEEAVSSCAASRTLEPQNVRLNKRGASGSKAPDPGTTPPWSVTEASYFRDSDLTPACSLKSGLKTLKAETTGKRRWEFAKDQKESESVRKKVLAAANNIRTQGKIQVSTAMSSIYRSKSQRRRRLLEPKIVASLAKFLVFQIPETEGED